MIVVRATARNFHALDLHKIVTLPLPTITAPLCTLHLYVRDQYSSIPFGTHILHHSISYHIRGDNVEIEASSLWEANEGNPAYHTVRLCHGLRAAYSHRVVLESEIGAVCLRLIGSP